MRRIFLLAIISIVSIAVKGQSIIGEWQLVKQTNCMEENLPAISDSTQNLVDDMKSRSSATPVTITFKEKMAGEESMRILTKRKTVNDKHFLYRFDGEMLVILDKKSRTITDSFMVEKFDNSSLIVSNVSRPCETRVFTRIK